ncbi:MAG: hydantoinase/oxoprolinase family protein [Xanthobacteraceae bacterium]
MRSVVGIDVGGTFTDCVVVDEDGSIYTDKSFTTPGNPGLGMVNALENVTASRGVDVTAVLRDARAVAIGTTSITNKLVTRGGAKVGLITTKGHEDAIFVGRILAKTEGLSEADKSDALKWSKPPSLVARSDIRGINERIDYAGSVLAALNEDEVLAGVNDFVGRGIEAIAVCLLWAFINPVHELRIRDLIRKHHPSIYVAIGSAVAPVLGEYERTNATILSAHLGALAQREMEVTRSLLASRGLSRPFLVMQTNGGCMWDEEAGLAPLNLIASGPVGGIIGAAKLGERMGYRNIIATDMGGTTFDVGVIVDGAPILADIAVHDRIRMALPHVEVVSIGAGGGSIAWVDKATGLLQVGPQSAGSVPGPVAYGQGGEEPTVTDADVVLGRIDPKRFFNGRKVLDREKAEAAIKAKVADPLGCDVFTAAKGILDIVDSRMGDLIRKLTIERGVDPRDFVLFSYGGAGPTHVGAYSREIGIQMAVVSPQASVFSALGIASSDVVRVYSRSHPLRSPFDPGQLNGLFERLEERAASELAARGVAAGNTTLARSLEMRFRHQVHQIKVPVPDPRLDAAGIGRIMERFVALYEQNFGAGTAVMEAGVEMLTFHVVATTRHGALNLPELPAGADDACVALSGSRPVYFADGFVDTPIYEHGRLAPGHKIVGPAILEGANTTLPLHPGQQLSVDAFNNLVIHFAA